MIALLLSLTMTCFSTQFGHLGDGYGGRSPTVLTGKPVTDKDIGIAHRTWPMGARVHVRNLRTGKSWIGIVLDRGPYGKVTPDGKWFNGAPMFRKRNRGRIGKFRGCADLTPALAKLIGHNGRDRVRITLLKRAKKSHLSKLKTPGNKRTGF